MDTVRLFRIVAVAEAVSWVGLLIGSVLKRAIVEQDIWVKIFGSIHGTIWIAMVALTILTWRELRWDRKTGIIALVATVPPFTTLWFKSWASRTGRLPEHSATPAAA